MKRYNYLFRLLALLCPLTLSAQNYTLDQFRRAAVDYSLVIKQTAAYAEYSKQNVKVARTNFYPQIDFSGQYSYLFETIPFLEIPGQGAINMKHDNYSLGLQAVQSLYSGGAVRNQYKANIIQKEIADLNQNLSYYNIVHAADMLYWTACANRGLTELSKTFLEITRSLEKTVQDRFDDGLVSRTDLLMVQSTTKEAELALVSSRQNYQIALQNLNVFMGRNPNDSVALSDSISLEIEVPLEVSLDSALINRPEYAIAQMEIELQKRNINLVKSKYNPKLAVGFKETWGTKMVNMDGSRLFNSTAFAQLSIPILRFGARFYETSAQKAILISKQLETQVQSDNISQELAKARTNYTEMGNQVKVLQSSVEIAIANLELNTLSYTEGRLPILDVLTAQQRWIQTYNRLINSWFGQKVAVADFYRAAGIDPIR